jgi:hypothetical protein
MLSRHPRPTTDPADLEAQFEAELGPLIATLLGVVGPMSVARISAVLARAGHFDPLRVEGYDDEDLEALVEWVVDDELVFFATGDDLVAHVPTVLDGVVLSHRLTPDEHERGMLDLGVDLAVLTRSRGRLPLFGGGHAVVHHHWSDRPELATAAAELGLPTDPRAADEGSLVGPPGWLDRLRPDRLLAAGLNGGTLAVVPACGSAGASTPSPHLVKALAAAAGRRPLLDDESDGRPDDLLLDALAHDPTLLRSPDAPLSVALDAAGLSWDGDALTRLGP